MVNLNQEVNLDSQLRALEALLYIPLDKIWGAQLKEENQRVWIMQEMNRKQKHKCKQLK